MQETRFRRGDAVRFQFGLYPVQGVVKEDRGPIGIKGRRLYLVEFPFGMHTEAPFEIELPAEKLELVRDTAAQGGTK